MATESDDTGVRQERLNANLARLEELSKRLATALTQRRQVDPSLHGPAPDVYMKAAAAYLAVPTPPPPAQFGLEIDQIDVG